MVKLEENLLITRCPHCSVDQPNLRRVQNFQTTDYRGGNNRLWKIYVCQRCGGVVTASSDRDNHFVKEMYPEQIFVHDAIPLRAKEYLIQAINSIHSPAGSIMLSASSVDSMLKEKGYVEGNLYSRIKNAAENHLITSEMEKWAHAVRLEANSQRHSDENFSLPSEYQAKKVIDFVMALGQFLYVLPSKVRSGINEASGEIQEKKEVAT